MPFSSNDGKPYPRAARLPCRMNLVEIAILPINVEETPYDSDFRQPIRLKKRDEVIIVKGQVNFGTQQKKAFMSLSPSPSIAWNTPGDINESQGYITFRRRELEIAKFMPKKGDLVVRLGDYTPDTGIQFRIEEVRPQAYLRGKALLFACELRRDRDHG